ncbi:YjcZ family sporulation protein [Pseudogracilibacillus sp. ICA-222130]
MSNVGYAGGYSIVLVLFILLVIVGAIYIGRNYC